MLIELLIRNLPYLFKGMGVTLALLGLLLLIGFVVGLPLALYQTIARQHWLVQLPALVYERVFRGIPIIVLLFIFFFGIETFNLGSFVAAVLALGLRSGAYQAQIFRSAIQSVPRDQFVAGRAMGMSTMKTLRHVILPQAMRHAIGPWTNEFSSELKATSLAYVIGTVELTRQADYIVTATSGHIIGIFSAVAVIYFVLNKLGNSFLYALERRMQIPGSIGG